MQARDTDLPGMLGSLDTLAYGIGTAVNAQKVDAIANTVPEAIKSSGKLIVGVNIPYSPNEFKDPSGKIVGFDVDLMDATAKVLGLTTQYTESDFDKIIPSITAGTYDVGMSSFTDNKEREKTVNFVDYFEAGTSFFEKATGGPKVTNLASICGLTVSVESGTTEQRFQA